VLKRPRSDNCHVGKRCHLRSIKCLIANTLHLSHHFTIDLTNCLPAGSKIETELLQVSCQLSFMLDLPMTFFNSQLNHSGFCWEKDWIPLIKCQHCILQSSPTSDKIIFMEICPQVLYVGLKILLLCYFFLNCH